MSYVAQTVRITKKRQQAIDLGLITLEDIQEAQAKGQYIDVQPLLNNYFSGGQTEALPTQAVIQETHEQAEERIREAFEIMEEMAHMAIAGDCRSLIISGPPGLGKSHKVLEALKTTYATNTVTKGYCKATGLYRILWKNRHAGSVAVFDDCDSVLYDETSLNFLKSACDTTKERTISYGAEFDMYDEEEGCPIPREFIFEGSIIFISNIDFDAAVAKGHKLAPHLAAMISRSHYIDLGLTSKRDCLIRIKHVVEDGALKDLGMTQIEQDEVVDFINENADHLRELSVRILLKVADIRGGKKTAAKWERMARATCCRNARYAQ